MNMNEKYPILGRLRLTYVHESGMVFSVIPLIGYDMKPEQMSAEFKVARIKLNEAVEAWEKKWVEKDE